MLIRQLFDYPTWTYAYILADEDTRDAVIIDPVLEQVERDLELIEALGLRLVHILETHVHADHVTGAGLLRDRTGARTMVGAGCDVACADGALADKDTVRFGRQALEVRQTPGHTDGCVTYVARDGDSVYAFTGDALFVRGCGRTDFQQGDPHTLYRSVHDQIYTLPDDAIVYPGHDYRGHQLSTVGEEKALNPRLAMGTTEERFVEIMNNLNLPNPKHMDVAVPRNLECGKEAS